MPPAGFEPAIPANDQPEILALDRSGKKSYSRILYRKIWRKILLPFECWLTSVKND
jgi:hypothetical protein